MIRRFRSIAAAILLLLLLATPALAQGGRLVYHDDAGKLDRSRVQSAAQPLINRGITGKGFDGRGNFAMGLKEQIVFPEINYDRVEDVRGMDIQFVTTAKTDAEAKALLKLFDLPFAN